MIADVINGHITRRRRNFIKGPSPPNSERWYHHTEDWIDQKNISISQKAIYLSHRKRLYLQTQTEAINKIKIKFILFAHAFLAIWIQLLTTLTSLWVIHNGASYSFYSDKNIHFFFVHRYFCLCVLMHVYIIHTLIYAHVERVSHWTWENEKEKEGMVSKSSWC